MIYNLDSKTLKIDQSIFFQAFLKEKNIKDYNSISILIKAGNVIEINKADNYKKTNLKAY